MKKRKQGPFVGLIALTGLSLFSLIFNVLNSHPTIKILESAVGFLGLVGLTIFLYVQVKTQEELKNIDYEK